MTAVLVAIDDIDTKRANDANDGWKGNYTSSITSFQKTKESPTYNS